MSEEIDLETNHLCTTENAFEKFQAQSMYEEEEFITLSDIVSPSHGNHDITEVLTDSLCQNDTIIQPVEIGQEEIISEPIHGPQLLEKSIENTILQQKNIPANKGRKKKKNSNDTKKTLNIDSELNLESIVEQEEKDLQIAATTSGKLTKTECIQNVRKDLSIVTEMTENKPKRRGRPPKRRNTEIQKCENDDINISMNTSNLETIRTYKIKNPDLTTSKTLSDCDVNINAKQNFDSHEKEIFKNTNTNLPLNDINITNETIDDDTEDMPLLALSTKKNDKVEIITDNVNNLEINIELENKELSDTISNPNPQQTEQDQFLEKKPKKRGRKRKSNINLIHQVPEINSDFEIKDSEKPNNEEDDISLSKLKDTFPVSTSTTDAPPVGNGLEENVEYLQNLDNTESNLINKRNSKKPVYSDYEYNIDSIINSDIKKDATDDKTCDSELLLTETARPVRRKAKKNLHYDEGSDEDPFANVELSDDEPRRKKKGGRYNSDDEYIPGNNRLQSDISDTDSNIEEEIEDEFKIHKKKKVRKSSLGFQKSPKKRSKQSIEDTLPSNENVDIELNLETSVIRAEDNKQSNQAKSWSATNEFENFLAKIVQGTDIEIKKAKSIDSLKTPLQIPTIDPSEEKKSVETSSQTDIIKTKPIAVQTSTLYDVPMKNQVALTAEQSQKAIEFLSGIVKTTSELGQLMTQKSEDFIEKKINTEYVTDTFKMDYCVKKSFLLFKLAKHNLVQMEEDLSKQYEEFLKENNLSQHREQEKVVASTSKVHSSDSDCEIVEEPIKNKKKEKPVFNPKTVFLNKELSIKIAKKPTEMPKAKEKIVVKGRHAVWINDSVMVKKVKPTQSFLAQDSRNKKPPDTFVTLQMVSDFFKMYERQKALSLCAPYIRHSWLQKETRYICNYFFDQPTKPSESSYVTPSEEVSTDVSYTQMDTDNTSNSMLTSKLDKKCPDSLLSICIQTLQSLMHFRKTLNCETCPSKSNNVHSKPHSPHNRKYVDNGDVPLRDVNRNDKCLNNQKLIHVTSLKTLCYKTIIQHINVPTFSESESGKVRTKCAETNNNYISEKNSDILNYEKNSACGLQVKSLFSMCVSVLQNPTRFPSKCKKQIELYKVKPLKDLVLGKIKTIIYAEFMPDHLSHKETYLKRVKSLSLLCTELISFKLSQTYDDKQHVLNYMSHSNQIGTSVVLPLKSISFKKVQSLLQSDNQNILVLDNDITLNFTIDNVNTVSEEIFNKNSEEGNENELNTHSEQYYSDNDFDISYDEGVENDETNWVSQVQMQELRSCAELTNNADCEKSQNSVQVDYDLNIKLEPLEDGFENVIDSATIKIEPEEIHDNLINYTSPHIITKQEDIVANSPKEPIQRKNSKSYDVDAFESFVSSNKIILSMENNNDSDEIFSQSASRIRRQYEPDSDGDIDTLYDTMNLLVPQSIETVKDTLLGSSSDEGASKRVGKKKIEKRKPRTKKSNKDFVDIAKEKTKTPSKLETLTRKMRGRIRLEEKKNESSDSEIDDDISLNLKKRKNHKIVSDTPLSQLQENEIQCNDVDSTEHINENKNEDEDSPIKSVEETQPSDSSLMIANVPIELLQCTPSITISENLTEGSKNINENDCQESFEHDESDEKGVSYTDRHGWKCYPIKDKDSKIYQYAYVAIDKLPESFVETYYRYQNVTEQTQVDTEIAKLTNLQSLYRSQAKGKSEGRKNVSTENPKTHSVEIDVKKNNLTDEESRELSPSEDEDNVVDNFVPDAPQQSSDNYLAKDLLMKDESDGESKIKKIKQEPDDELSPKTRSGRQLRSKGDDKREEKEKPKAEDLMLTADKMMNTELKLLHAPVEVKHEIEDVKYTENKPNTRNSNKKMPKSNVTKIRIKDENASSSEEEKQWVTTKEKLLKRLEKKQETPSVDDAKRAKIVNEYIEKCGDAIETSRQRARPRRRSKKKLLERRKQMKILSRELFGDESPLTGKKYQSQAYSKGRRNIRKVIDKKLLARSTVLANMEEFERKRRLNQRQAQLREVLGCEEGVNVVVINDELCLEYDFENTRPLVTVHQFFTKVMKAHQYEGVKFMWDACFESVSAAARRGSGCILAHCMGLGKTLQVLALLHTVMTHPQLNMRRVLVCCPLSTVLNWVDEINKWMGPVTNNIKVFELSKLKKTYERAYQLEDWYNGGGIFIIGYELFRNLSTLHPSIDCVRPTIVNKIRTALLDPGPDIIVCDEGHLLKNDCSVLAVAMSRVATRRRIVLTGTPMQNNLREYYCMVNFVKPNLLGTYSEYSNRFENPIMNGQHRDSREEDIKLMKARTHILHKVLEGCLQRQEASVLYPYLPKKHEYTLFISPTKCQWDLYKHYLANYAKEAKQSVLKDYHILQKIWTHPQVLHNFLTKARNEGKDSKIKVEKIEDDLAQEDLAATEDIKPGTTETWWLQYVADTNSLDSLESSNKFLVVFHLLDECTALGDKVLIFSTSLYTMDALEYFLRRKQWALGKEYYRLDGSVPAEVRQKWCREFNAPSNTTTKLFLISTRAGSLGLNMTAANRVIILDTSWNPAHDIQSIFRVYRFGQKKDCYIYRLVAMGTMEQKIYERSVTKQAVACRVVDEQQIDRHYNMSELSELYRVDEAGCSVAAGLAAGVRDAALLRVAGGRGGALHAVHEHDSLLRGSGETNLPEHERAAAWMQFQQEHSNTHNNIQNIELKIPTKSDDGNDLDPNNPPTNKQELKSKKNKRSTTVKDNMLSQPSTSAQIDPTLDPVVESAMVEKIMDILIKHQYHESKGPKEIAALIKNVRNTIANIEDGFDNVDPLTASIAKVLIESERENQSLNTVRSEVQSSFNWKDLELISSDSDTISADNLRYTNKNSDRKRSKQRQDSDEEYVPQGTRKRKKAHISDKYTSKISNEMSNSSGSSKTIDNVKNLKPLTANVSTILYGEVDHNVDNVTCDDQQIDSNEDIALAKSDSETTSADEFHEENMPLPDRKRLKHILPKATGKMKKAKASDKYISRKSDKKSLNETVNSLSGFVQNSMLLQAAKSLPTEKESGESALIEERTVQNEPVTLLKDVEHITDNTNEVSIVLSDDDEPVITPSVSVEEVKKNAITDKPVPMHKSLLTNANFIKIIAHTYLSGNPKLDEDAALLAAQYSALKALREVEATGKDIVSGPLYDIAHQVLGIALLERLQNVRGNRHDLTNTINESTSLVNISSASNKTKDVQSEQSNTATASNKDSETSANAPKQYKKKANIMQGSKKINEKSISEGTSESVENSQSESVDDATRLAATEQMLSLSASAASQASAEVVPVGMFKGSVSLEASETPLLEECILPDDDKIITNNSQASASSVNIRRRNSQQLFITNVLSDATIKQSESQFIISTVDDIKSAGISTPGAPGIKYLQVIPPSLKGSPLKAPATVTPPKSEPRNYLTKSPKFRNILPKPAPQNTETICLDSDEEDTVVKKVKSKPVALKSTTKLPYLPAQSKKTEVKKQILYKSPLEKKELSKSIASSNTTNEDVQKLQNANKAKCKPGDIIRITESGKIEILRRTEVKPTQSSIVPQNQKTTNHEKTDSVKTIVEKDQSKGSTDQKDESPLSVLQNVVHIPADQYEAQTKSAVVNESNVKILPPTPKTVKLKYPNKTVTVPVLGSTVKEIQGKNKNIITKSATKNEIVLKYASANVSTSKPQEKVIDLTASLISTKGKKQIVVKKKDWDKISGTSKDIVLNNAGTLFKLNQHNASVDLSNASSTKTVTVKKSMSSLLKPSTSDSLKRSTTSQDASSKKKPKVETAKKPLTLQDFNLDDFDDIIELE